MSGFSGFSEAALLYAEHASVIALVREKFQTDVYAFLDALQDEIINLLHPIKLQVSITQPPTRFRYWWVGDHLDPEGLLLSPLVYVDLRLPESLWLSWSCRRSPRSATLTRRSSFLDVVGPEMTPGPGSGRPSWPPTRCYGNVRRMGTTVGFQALRSFRADLYGCFRRRADALFELADALLTAGLVPSLAHLSLTAVHRRGGAACTTPWRRASGRRGAAGGGGALAPGRRAADLRAGHERLAARRRRDQPGAGLPLPPVAAVGRPADRRRAGRTSGSRRSASPTIAGPLPLDVRRVPPDRERPRRRRRADPGPARSPGRRGRPAVRVRRRLRPGEAGPGAGRPAGRGAGAAAHGRAASTPTRRPAVPSPLGGRPRRHGAKFACDDPTTWRAPTAEHAARTRSTATCACARWAGLHAKKQDHPDRGTRQPRPTVRGTLVLVEVERLPRQTRTRRSALAVVARPRRARPRRPLAGVRPPLRPGAHLPLLQADAQLDHAARPPPRAGRPLDLAGAARLHPAPPRPSLGRRSAPALGAAAPPERLTPSASAAPFAPLPLLGTPADAPKPCGRSPGRPKGRRSGRATRYPALKKAA